MSSIGSHLGINDHPMKVTAQLVFQRALPDLRLMTNLACSSMNKRTVSALLLRDKWVQLAQWRKVESVQLAEWRKAKWVQLA